MTLIIVKSVAACALLALPLQMVTPHAGIFPPGSIAYGRSYAEWSVAWQQWNMGHPLAGHPGLDTPQFNVASGQSGKVWFLSTPVAFGTATPPALTRNITIPKGTALFVGTINGEMSSLEGAATEAEQRAIANFQADRIVIEDLTFTLDGQPVDNLGDYRFETEQFTFTTAEPEWIFSPAPTGTGTAVADGCFLFLKPLSIGQHVLHYTGGFHFEAGIFGPEPFDITADQTYVITVTP